MNVPVSTCARWIGVFGFLVLVLSSAITAVQADESVTTLSVQSVDELVKRYRDENYTLNDIQNDKYIILEELPHDFDTLRDVKLRKTLFQRIVLPLIYFENERIASERALLTGLKNRLEADSSATIPERHKQHLQYLGERYDLDEDYSENEYQGLIEGLMQRVNTIPPSLVLAQATNESGWGTSRFAIKGNNLFGVRSYDESTPGFKPKGVPDTSSFRVRKFATLLDSVQNYMTTLNTHHAYREFRVLRSRNPSGDPLKLVQGLTQYSERREEYLNRLVTLIKGNNYRRFDN